MNLAITALLLDGLSSSTLGWRGLVPGGVRVPPVVTPGSKKVVGRLTGVIIPRYVLIGGAGDPPPYYRPVKVIGARPGTRLFLGTGARSS